MSVTLIERPAKPAYADGPPVDGPLIDGQGRRVTYLRLSVTDRCDLRCTYCMPERMTFLPRRDLLTPGELDRLASAFIERGVTKLRITGGEPLVRPGAVDLIKGLSRHLSTGALSELTLTTNGTQLAGHAGRVAAAGVRRVNVSLDSVVPETYARVTRGGDVSRVLEGMAAARAAGIAVKINAVALARDNAHELDGLIEWAHGEGYGVTLIEVMPMAETGEDRLGQYLPLTGVRERLAERWTLTPSDARTGGPARYWDIAETGGRLGLITPLTENFCGGCNRVRVTATGRLVLCLGHEDGADLRAPMREGADVGAVIDAGLGTKPLRHDFERAYESGTARPRHMNVTGG